MQRFISAILLTAILLTHGEFHELVKFPVLILHYLEHRNADHSISPGEFFYMHYLAGEQHKEESPSAQDLPFKSDHSHLFTGVSVETPRCYELSLQPPQEPLPVLPDYNSGMISSLHKSEIWQPPRQS